MKNSKKKESGEKKDTSASLGDLRKKQSQLSLEIALGKSRDTAELRDIRREIARRMTAVNNEQKTENNERET